MRGTALEVQPRVGALGAAAGIAGVQVMRRLVGTAVFAGCTLVAGSMAAATPGPGDASRERSNQPAVAVQQVRLPLPAVRDEAAMVLVGAALIALGGVVRRSA